MTPPPFRTGARCTPRRSLAVCGAVALTLSVAGCGGAAADDAKPEKRSFALAGRTLTIDSRNSDLVLVPADVREVQVTRWFDGWSVFGTVDRPTWSMHDGTLSLRVECGGLISNCAARHEIRVPRGVEVRASESNGSVRASGFSARLRLSSNNGDVSVHGSSGPLGLRTHNGGIDATGNTARRISAESANGDVRVSAARTPDRVTARTENGDITLTVPDTSYRVTAAGRNGGVSVDVPRADRSRHVLDAHSANGGITVRAGDGPSR